MCPRRRVESGAVSFAKCTLSPVRLTLSRRIVAKQDADVRNGCTEVLIAPYEPHRGTRHRHTLVASKCFGCILLWGNRSGRHALRSDTWVSWPRIYIKINQKPWRGVQIRRGGSTGHPIDPAGGGGENMNICLASYTTTGLTGHRFESLPR